MEMKKQCAALLIGIGCLIASEKSIAQSSLTIDASQNMTNFNFTNSGGERDMNYSPNFSGSYNLGYRYRTDFGLFGGARIGMRGAGASTIIDDANYSWDLQYLNANLDIGYEYELGKVSPYLMVSPYFGRLLSATQTLNHQDYNIINSGDLKQSDFGLFGSLGARFAASDLISVYAQLNYMMGLQNLETNESQTSNNTLMGISLGLSFSIK
jgi:hypothetical protein